MFEAPKHSLSEVQHSGGKKMPSFVRTTAKFSQDMTQDPTIGPDYKPFTHPKSAPIRPGPEVASSSSGFGGHIFSMHVSEDARKQKQLQQKTYFQELTRQIQEKKETKPGEILSSSKGPAQTEQVQSVITEFGSELKKLPFP